MSLYTIPSIHFHDALFLCFGSRHLGVHIMAAISPTTLTILFGVVALYVIKRLRLKSVNRPLPPGPKGLPVLGNVNDMPGPGMLECHHWLKHKDLYGARHLEDARLIS